MLQNHKSWCPLIFLVKIFIGKVYKSNKGKNTEIRKSWIKNTPILYFSSWTKTKIEIAKKVSFFFSCVQFYLRGFKWLINNY